MISGIEREFGSFSRWFRWSFYLLFCVYLATWLFTIELASLQEVRGLKPVLPVMPKDSEEYQELVESIIYKGEFSNGGKLSTVRAPGYVSFAALIRVIGRSYFAVTLMQIFLVFGAALIVRRLGLFFADSRVGELSALLVLVNPVNLITTLNILTDILFLFVFLLAFYLAINNQGSRKKIICSSLLFAAAIYIRPMGVFAIPIFIAPFLIAKTVWREKINHLILLGLIIFSSMVPWMWRNYQNTGVFGFTSFKSINLVGYAVPPFLAHQNGTTEEIEKVKIEQELGIARDKWRDLKYSKEISSAMQHKILEQPIDYLKFHIVSSLPFLFSSTIQYTVQSYEAAMHIDREFKSGIIKYLTAGDWTSFIKGLVGEWWKFSERLIWLVVYTIALVGFWIKKREIWAWVFIAIPIYLMLLTGPAANIRYALPAMPFIFLLFNVGLFYIKSKLFSNYV